LFGGDEASTIVDTWNKNAGEEQTGRQEHLGIWNKNKKGRKKESGGHRIKRRTMGQRLETAKNPLKKRQTARKSLGEAGLRARD